MLVRFNNFVKNWFDERSELIQSFIIENAPMYLMTTYLLDVDTSKRTMYKSGLANFLRNNNISTKFEVMVKSNELHTD